MRLGLLTAPLLALSLACSFDAQGTEGSSGDDVANTGSETATTGSEDEIGTDQGTSQGDTSSESTGDGDDPTTSESTTDTTESTTDSTESTTDSTESTTDTTDTTTETTTETTTDTGMEIPPYGNCPGGDDDCAIGEMCMHDFDLADDWQVCGTSCGNANDCPPIDGFSPTCIEQGFMAKACYINCENSGCPQGMACKSVNVGFDKVCAFDS
ncbi:hypothetical protein ACNOYE_33750 [Nannocystaceae bacterium ST9]